MRNSGHNTYKAFNGREGLEIFEKEHIDLIILDIMMPLFDGKEVLRKVREKDNVPVVFLSAKGEDIDKIDGLFLGADDYISKPFNPLELVARVTALLRRSTIFNKNKEESEIMVIDEYLKLNEKTCKVYKDNLELQLTSVEYKLINFLMKNKNKVFTKRQLYEKVWEQSYLEDERIIMVYISKLREKIEVNPKEPKYIKTVRGLGYIFESN